MADWATIEAERFQDLHCRPDGITLTAGARVNLANTLRHIADERVRVLAAALKDVLETMDELDQPLCETVAHENLECNCLGEKYMSLARAALKEVE